ncbi:MAG: hypothetical protein FJW90_13080, partial [Actinobacteria bacterium]|nr:hypothetical protein [Actinomycetota bacterium]
MYEKMKQAIRGRTGPVGLSLVAAAVTAVAFAGISVAADGGGSDQQGQAEDGRAGGPPVFQMRPSEADREALEEFRRCMADEG